MEGVCVCACPFPLGSFFSFPPAPPPVCKTFQAPLPPCSPSYYCTPTSISDSFINPITHTNSLYQNHPLPHSVGIFLLLVASIQPIFDAIIFGNLFQGFKGFLQTHQCCRLRKPAHHHLHQQHQQDAAAGAALSENAHTFPRPKSRNLSSVKYLNSLVSSFAGGGAGIWGGLSSHIESPPAALFVTTFNMGPIKDLGGLGGRLEEWVPASGYEIYVIGLQECHCVEEVRAALHEHVGGPAAYHMFEAEVGASTILYGSIALTVLARTADVASGAFAAVGAETSRVRNGVNLVITKASNKGMAGLSFRYHDATLAFVTCHYASDSGGKKRLRQRNEDARRTLREVKLTDDEGFDVYLHHHHTFVCGDLNYRLRLPARGVVERVAETARQMEASVWQDGEMAALEAAAAAAVAAAGGKLAEADDEDGEPAVEKEKCDSMWMAGPPEDEESGGGGQEEEEESERGNEEEEADIVEVGELERDEGPNWVSKAYMKLFTEAGEEQAVVSFLSHASSSYVGNGSSFPSRESAASRDESTDTETEYSTGEGQDQSLGMVVEGFGEGRGGQRVVLTANGATTRSSSTGAGTGAIAAEEATSPGLAVRGWFAQHFRALAPLALHENRSSMHTSSDAFSSFSSSSDAFLVYSPKAPAGSLWDWVAEYDELMLEMRAGQVFAGFAEGPLTFPPPFRWRRGGNAGNFTKDEQVAGAYVLMKKGDGERVPSYTDRILFHSLPDVSQNLHLVAYQMCDHVKGSDHRPVSAAFHLTLNRARVGFHTHLPEDGPIVSPGRPIDIEYPAASTWGVQVFDALYKPYRFRPSLVLESQRSTKSVSVPKDAASAPSPMVSPPSLLPSLTSRTSSMPLPAIGAQPHWKVALYFPCVLEDPWAADAKVRDIELALLAADDHQPEHARQARELKGMQRCHETTWAKLASSQGLAFDVLVLPAVSRHALVRLTDGRTNTEIGQGVVCLRQAFSDPPEGGGLQWVNNLLHRNSNRETQQGAEVLISNHGKAVGLLRLQIKIRRHKK
jgi:hypothetical protein